MQPIDEPAGPAHWPPALRVAFRFAFAYFALIIIPGRLLGWLPFGERLQERYTLLWHGVVVWVGQHVIHTAYDLSEAEGGISNSAHGTIEMFCYLAVALLAAAVWSVLDRRRTEYGRLHGWFRVMLRFALAPAMIHYGMLKIVPTQMIAPPPLGLQAQRLGELHPNQMLWAFMGTSPTYESLTGLAELGGGLLLLFPPTTLLGALLTFANMLMVFTMNMCFDVHVKAWSMHLMLMAALLVAPDLRRLADVVLLNRTAPPRRDVPLCRGRWLRWLPHAAVLLMGVSMLVRSAGEVKQRAAKLYPPQPPLYGLWSVDEMAVDGRVVPPNTDPGRWRLVTFKTPGVIQVESDIGTKTKYPARVDPKTATIALPNGTLHFAARGDAVTLDGLLDGRPTRAKLTRMPLVSQPWRWIYVFGPDD